MLDLLELDENPPEIDPYPVSDFALSTFLSTTNDIADLSGHVTPYHEHDSLSSYSENISIGVRHNPLLSAPSQDEPVQDELTDEITAAIMNHGPIEKMAPLPKDRKILEKLIRRGTHRPLHSDKVEDVQRQQQEHMQQEHMQQEHMQHDHMQHDHMQLNHMQHDHMQLNHMQLNHMQLNHMQQEHMQQDHIQHDHMQQEQMQHDHLMPTDVDGIPLFGFGDTLGASLSQDLVINESMDGKDVVMDGSAGLGSMAQGGIFHHEATIHGLNQSIQHSMQFGASNIDQSNPMMMPVEPTRDVRMDAMPVQEQETPMATVAPPKQTSDLCALERSVETTTSHHRSPNPPAIHPTPMSQPLASPPPNEIAPSGSSDPPIQQQEMHITQEQPEPDHQKLKQTAPAAAQNPELTILVDNLVPLVATLCSISIQIHDVLTQMQSRWNPNAIIDEGTSAPGEMVKSEEAPGGRARANVVKHEARTESHPYAEMKPSASSGSQLGRVVSEDEGRKAVSSQDPVKQRQGNQTRLPSSAMMAQADPAKVREAIYSYVDDATCQYGGDISTLLPLPPTALFIPSKGEDAPSWVLRKRGVQTFQIQGPNGFYAAYDAMLRASSNVFVKRNPEQIIMHDRSSDRHELQTKVGSLLKMFGKTKDARIQLRYSLESGRSGWELRSTTGEMGNVIFPVVKWGDVLRSLLAALAYRKWRVELSNVS